MINENFDHFCEKCNFILRNIKTINDTNELTEHMMTQEFKFEEEICKFCFGILSQDHEKDLFNQIGDRIKKFEYTDFKLTTSFSPLYLILHNYWKIKLKNKIQDNKQLNSIDVPLFRKTFKPLMISKVSKLLETSHSNRSDFEVRCVFEFNEKFYSEVDLS